ncbi:DUF2501 domain-containing protein [Acetobacter conturbans]|uniref:DUF2501 domain-containing protein n=1 Tax=Acetobacter conturbans TaxID=1737472 RepID=A0ABX0JZD9_9PROT|nr:DUF2501 domain-containing protein [Acetobacter conturbans]NHN87380.1 DUF2501 domain-containing protein [Acetobacter conturbans]
MAIRRFGALALVCGLSVAGVSVAQAQSLSGIAQGAEQGAMQNALGSTTSSSTTGSTSGLLGAMGVPSLSSASSGNVAGVLSYCVQNNLVSNVSSAKSTLSTLSGQSAVTGDTSYASGQQGLLQVGNGNQLSLSTLKAKARKKLCKAVESKASSLI